MSNLNPSQSEAVRYIDGPLLVLAGAGSGKTRVITRKIAYLIKECGLSPRHIAAVTFTNKAAREMKERVGQLLVGREGHGLRVSTFHTLGLDIIRSELKHLDHKPGFSIFDAQDSAGLIRELLRREGGSDGLDQEIQRRISDWKNALITPEQAVSHADDTASFAASQIYAEYNRHLKAYNAVDFDDLIMLPVLLFERKPEVLERWQNRIRHLLVDEYQDTNITQYRLVRMLVGLRGALTVVGDDDQSIYAWRGARPENLVELGKDFPGLKVVKLEQNYRSMGCILKAANRLIGNNPHVFEKRLWSEMGYGEPIRVVRARDEEDEAVKVVSSLMHHRFQKRTDFSDYAILYRGNHQSRLFEKALREQRIPYQISGGASFFSYSEVKDVLAYLRLLINPDDDTAFLRVVNTPRREIGPSTLEKLGNYASQRGIGLFSASFELGLTQVLKERQLNRLRAFTEWIVAIGDRARRGDPLAAMREMAQEIGYESWLRDTCPSLKQAERKMKNVEELFDWIARMAGKEDGEPDLGELVAKLTLMDILERNEEDEDRDRVRLMTLHAAKGLEFPNVFLVGMEEELLPHRTSIEEDSIEEERRLAYVGITRAQQNLTLTLANRRRRGGEVVRCEPSRFIAELPEEDLKWEGAGIEAPAEEKQERGKAHLAALRGMLGTET
ncbi:DNA helicase Rep [Thiohalomonas denitrificans]|uniref:ATP-dependent DNA helicase Rep n=1 Tax=Thiohalomonas denitrificans TaxID=415747 RepID=A0A1G5QS10_9GAMM|nr:DNA helicase Rep [Thiohalomonas denitrificans]SCZ64674.1 ATP-dependent DNA helicase Rep [Thiohalomonas denitrificans]